MTREYVPTIGQDGAGAPPSGRHVLRVESVDKAYRNTNVLEGVSLAVGQGEIVGLLGPNGAGKSTLIKCIAGLLRPARGEIWVDDFAVRSSDARRRTGYIPEVPALYDLMTPWEHLEFFAQAYDVEDWTERAESLLGKLGLTEKRDALSGELSKGMRQKVLIACALLHQPLLYLFDEPTVGLDPQAQRELTRQMRELREQGAALLVSTHILAQIEPIADRAVILAGGRTLASGTLAELREVYRLPQDAPLEDVFLQVTE